MFNSRNETLEIISFKLCWCNTSGQLFSIYFLINCDVIEN